MTKIRTVLDTNILISSIFWEGNPSKILQRAEEGRFILVISNEIISELRKVLSEERFKVKFEEAQLDIKEVINKIYSLSKIISPEQTLNVIKDDR